MKTKLRFLIITVLMMLSFWGCANRVDNTPTELSDYFIIDDSIYINGLEWGTMTEDAVEILGSLEETKSESTRYPCEWSKKQLSIDELDIVSDSIAYFFDEEAGFCSVDINFHIDGYDETVKIYNQMKDLLSEKFADPWYFKFEEGGEIRIKEFNGEDYLMPTYEWTTLELKPVNFFVGVEIGDECIIQWMISKTVTIFRY